MITKKNKTKQNKQKKHLGEYFSLKIKTGFNEGGKINHSYIKKKSWFLNFFQRRLEGQAADLKDEDDELSKNADRKDKSNKIKLWKKNKKIRRSDAEVHYSI